MEHTRGSSSDMKCGNSGGGWAAAGCNGRRSRTEPGSGVLSLNSLGNKEGLRETRAGLVGSSGG